MGTNNCAHTPSHTAANIVEGIESIVWYIYGINSSIKVLVLVRIFFILSLTNQGVIRKLSSRLAWAASFAIQLSTSFPGSLVYASTSLKELGLDRLEILERGCLAHSYRYE